MNNHLKNVIDLFTPNKVVEKQIFLGAIIFQIILFFLFWNYYHGELLPSPIDVFCGLKTMISEERIIPELVVSTLLLIKSMLIALSISLFISYLSTLPFFKTIGLASTKFRFFSSIGFTFFFTLITSDGETLKASILVFVISSFFVTSMISVINGIQPKAYNYAKTMRMDEWESLWFIVIRGKLGDVFEITRQTFAIGWGMITMVEGLSRAGGGIGPILLNQNKQLHLDNVFAIQLVIFVIGLSQDYLIGVLKNIFCSYENNKR